MTLGNILETDINMINADIALKVFKETGDIMTGNLNMNGNRITDVYDPIYNQHAAAKYYVDTLGFPKFVVKTGMLSTSTPVDHVIYTFPSNKTFTNNKILVNGIWVERQSGDWISTTSTNFTGLWVNFQLRERGTTLIAYYTAVPSGWTCNCRTQTMEFT